MMRMQTPLISTNKTPAPASERSVAILRRKTVEEITGLSRSLIYEGIKDGTFPAPIKLTANTVGWLSHEIQAWIQDKIDRRK
jgi:prophage regulatory protein